MKQPLPEGQKPSYALYKAALQQHVVASARPLVLITDWGRDHDDELAGCVIKGLEKLGYVDLVGAVANLSKDGDPSRAQLTACGLDALGFETKGHNPLPVAVGADDTPEKYAVNPYEFRAGYVKQGREVHPDGQQLLGELCQRALAEGRKLDVAVIAGMTDLRDFIRDNPIAIEAIGRVFIMGGLEVDPATHEPVHDANGHVRPLTTAYNNKVARAGDEPAQELYASRQEFGIEMIVMGAGAAYAAAITPADYAAFRACKHPVADRLADRQQDAVEGNLWGFVIPHIRGQDYQLEAGEEKGKRLPDRAWEKGLQWFHDVFTDRGPGTLEALRKLPRDIDECRSQGVSPWEHVTRLNAYDPLTLMSAYLPNARQVFALNQASTTVSTFGLTPEKHGVKDPMAVRQSLLTLAKFGMSKAPTLQGYLDEQANSHTLSPFETALYQEMIQEQAHGKWAKTVAEGAVTVGVGVAGRAA